MASICFYFQVHQPLRVKRYRVFDIGNDNYYFNDGSDTDLNNKKVLLKVAEKSYIPATKLLKKIIKKHPEFRCAFSFSGLVLDQLEEWSPETIQHFKDLVKTGNVEILAETYHHSLSYLYSPKEFKRQVKMHKHRIESLFGVQPEIFRNTELIYNNDIAIWAEKQGYKGILAEGVDAHLDSRSPNMVYKPTGARSIGLLVKNYTLSDDVAFRFSNKEWQEYPLTASKYASWLESYSSDDTINIFMDFETFGEHQWEETGIFTFLLDLPKEVLKKNISFKTPSETIEAYAFEEEMDVPYATSWADRERDLSAWLGNEMQHEAIESLYKLEEKVTQTKDARIIEDWRRLQASDNFYYMSTKRMSDGSVHHYFNPYESPYDAFITYMNALKDLSYRADAVLAPAKSREDEHITVFA